jgi:hypothetical protein
LLATAGVIQGTTGLLAGLESYMASVTGLTTANINSELGAVLAALNTLISAIQADYPVDTNGHLLDRTFSSGNVVAIGFTAAQLPNTTAAISTWLAAIQ